MKTESMDEIFSLVAESHGITAEEVKREIEALAKDGDINIRRALTAVGKSPETATAEDIVRGYVLTLARKLIE